MKICPACQKTKVEEEFNWKYKAKGKRCATCRDCMRLYIRNHYNDNVDYYVKKALRRKKSYMMETYKRLLNYFQAHPCVDCGETDPVVLEFDHINRKEKLMEVSKLVSLQRPWRIVFAEINKCQVRCANCHRRKTAKEQNWNLYLLSRQISLSLNQPSFIK
jgi:hypothetical protein